MKKRLNQPYVSRGGVKLEHALREFKIDVNGKIALDVGASTGGFTDCLLQHGAARVYAIDVAYGQFAWKLRQDPRVAVVERTNIRYLKPEELYNRELKVDNRKPACRLRPDGHQPEGQARSKIENRSTNLWASLAVIDVSFISLSKVLPAVYNLLADEAEVIALIKPQFEAKREQVERGGIVKDKQVHEEVIEKVKAQAQAAGFEVQGVIESPITGADGNVEFFTYLQKGLFPAP